MRTSSARYVTLLATALSIMLPARAGLIEAFESPEGISSEDGKLGTVKGGEGVTQGAAAAQMPPGSSFRVTAAGKQLSSSAWLKLDVLVVDPMMCRVRIRFEGEGMRTSHVAHVTPGQQTLSLPLCVPLGHAGAASWPEGEVQVVFVNEGEAPLVVDNLRAEPAASPPEGAVLVDFGPGTATGWPGFKRGDVESRRMIWSGEGRVRGESPGFPDPLLGDFVGPRLGDRERDSFRINLDEGNYFGYLWLTHYAGRDTQPMEYGLIGNRRRLVHERHTPATMLGPDGLLIGREGDWTPEWFASEYPAALTERVEVKSLSRGTRFEVLNMQLAALAVAPAKHRDALAAYVDQVETDLALFRRQFVVAARVRARCLLAPTADEQRDGLIALQPGGERLCDPAWSAGPDDRLERVELDVAPGIAGRTMLALAAVRDVRRVAVSLELPRNEGGRGLPMDPDRTSVHILQAVPRVRDGRVEMQPWVLGKDARMISAGEVICAVVTVAVPSTAPAGTYDGAVRVNMPGGAARIPLRVTVHDCGPADSPDTPRITAHSDAGIVDVHHALGEALPGKARKAAERASRTRVMELGINGLLLPGPSLSKGLAVWSGRTRAYFDDYPRGLADGTTLFDMGSALWRLRNRRVPPQTEASRRALRGVVTGIRRIAGGKLPGRYLHYMGSQRGKGGIQNLARLARDVAAGDGRPVMRVRASDLTGGEIDPEWRAGVLRPFQALVLEPNHGVTAEIIRDFKSLGGDRQVYLYTWRPDRYLMGFYAAGVGADGICLDGPYMVSGGPYDGFHLRGRALLVPQPEGRFAETLATHVFRQGIGEYRLMMRALSVRREADAAGVDAGELEAVLTAVSKAASDRAAGGDTTALELDAARTAELDELRRKVIRAVATVQKRLEDHRTAGP